MIWGKMLICVNLIVKKLFSSNLAQKDFGIMIRILSGYSWWVKWVPVLLGTSGVFSGIGVRPTPAMSCSKCRKLWEKRCKRSLRRGLPSTSVDQFFFLCHVPVSLTQLLHNRAPVAQLIEHWVVMREVVSSTPAGPTLRVWVESAAFVIASANG